MASKYPQRICFCNASDMPHKHEDSGIVDYPGAIRPPSTVMPPGSTIKPQGFVAAGKQ